MKKLVLLFTILVSANLSAQNPLYEDLMIFIPQHGNYLPLKYSQHGIKNSYGPYIQKYLESKNEKVEDYYVFEDNVVYTTSNGSTIGEQHFVWLPLYHIDTFWKLRALKREDEKKYNELNNGKRDVYGMMGNASGKDGVMEINTTTGEVKFTIWE